MTILYIFVGIFVLSAIVKFAYERGQSDLKRDIVRQQHDVVKNLMEEFKGADITVVDSEGVHHSVDTGAEEAEEDTKET